MLNWLFQEFLLKLTLRREMDPECEWAVRMLTISVKLNAWATLKLGLRTKSSFDTCPRVFLLPGITSSEAKPGYIFVYLGFFWAISLECNPRMFTS